MRQYSELSDNDKLELVSKASELQKSDRTLVHSIKALDLDYRGVVQLILDYDFLNYEDSYIARRTLTRVANCLDKYGETTNLNLPETKKKTIASCHTPEANAKRKATNLERFGAETPLNAGTSSREKYQQTMLEKYGVTNPFCHGVIRDRANRACLQEHGMTLAKYGNLKAQETTKKHYGVKFYFQTKDANKKILENLRARGFGGPTSVHYGEKTVKILSSRETLEEFILSVDPKDRFRDVLADKLGMSVQQFNYYLRVYKLRKLLRKQGGTSKAELEIGDIIEGWGIDIVRRTRTIIAPYEIDIYLPNYKIGIEYDGSYWHNGHEDRHKLKDELAEEKGIKLIHIKEEDYLSDQNSVILSLFVLLGLDKEFTLVLDSKEIKHELQEFYDIGVEDESHNFLIKQGVVHNSADFRQILSTKGFEVGYTSLDRTPDGYDGLRSAIYDKRIILLKNNEVLYDELTNLERDNMSRKYDHPINSSKDTCLSGDTKLFLLSGKELTIEELYNSDYLDEWVLSCDKENQRVVPVKIEGVVQKEYIPKILYKITLDNNEQFSVTGNHKILLRDGSYKRADELSVGESLMPFNVYKEFRYRDYYRKVVNPFTNKSDWIYQLVVHSIKQDEFDSVRLDLDGSPYKVIHHQDHNKLNDSPNNLKPMTLRAHRKLHGDIFKKYNTSDAKRKKTSELALERKVGFGYVYDTQGSDLFKKNGTQQITKYNKSEKHRRETSERNIRTNAWLYMKGTSHTPEANAKRRATRNALGYDKAFSQQVSLQNQDPVIKHNQQLGKVKKMYQIVLDNSDLFNKSNVTFEDFLKEIDVLKAKGVISQKFYCKKDYGLFIEAGIPLTNHKIISIEVIQNDQPVYDLQLSTIHNFGISAGVFVHNCDALAGAHMDAMQYKDEFMFFHPDDYDYEGLNSSISEEDRVRDSLIKSISPSNQKVDSGKTLPSDFYNDAILNVENNVQNFPQKNKKLDPSDIFADIDSSSYGNDDNILWL